MIMSLRKSAFLASAITIALVAAVPASAAQNDTAPTARAMQLVNGGHAGEAFALLAPLETAHAGDAEFDYALGIAAIDSGHQAEAIIALQRVLVVQPGNSQARAELARAYAMAGDIDTARREFDTVAGDTSIPDPVRQRFNSLIRGFDRTIKPGQSITGYIEGGGGYDSNVNAATSASQLVIPVFSFLGPATLSSAARQQGDGFGSVEGGVSGEYGFDRQSRVFASVLGSGRFNAAQTQLNQALGSATVGFAHTAANRDVVSLSLQSQQFWLGGVRYRSAVGAVAQYTHRLPGGSSLSAQLQAFDVRYPTDMARDAHRYGAAINYAGRVLYVAVQGGHEQTTQAASNHLTNDYGGVRAAFEKPLTNNFAVFGSAGLELRRYAAADPLFLVRRNDDQYDVSAGVRIRIAPHITAAPQASYTRNRSNIVIYDYERIVGSATVRFDF